jgi:hypothetical protein
MKKHTLALLALLVVFCCGCPVVDPISETIDVHNNTGKPVYVFSTCNDSLEPLPELVLFETQVRDGVEWKFAPPYRVPAFSTKSVIAYGRRVDYVNLCDNQEINLFFINEDTLRLNSWSEICTYQKFEKRIKLSLDELEQRNWVVFYSN